MSILVYKQRHRHPNRKGTPGANYGHVRYIATRPGVMKNEGMGHGLFGKMKPGVLTCFGDWREVAKQAYADARKGCIMYRGVVSFAPQTAKELMLENQRSWQRYIENHILTIAGKRNTAGAPEMGCRRAWGERPSASPCGVLGQFGQGAEPFYAARDTGCHQKADDKGYLFGKDTCLCKREGCGSQRNTPDHRRAGAAV